MAAVAFPFVCLPDAAICHPGLSSHAKILFAALLSHRNWKSGLCNPGLKTLAQELGKSLSTIRRALAQLARAGMVLVNRTLFGNRYEIATPDRWQTTISATDCALTDEQCASLTDERCVRSRVSAQEPDVLEPEEEQPAAAGFVHTPMAAAAVPPPPRVSPKPNTPASPPADLWNGPAEEPPTTQTTQTLPAVPGRIRALAQAMSERLLAAPHPNPICQDRAAPAIEAILRAAPDVEATAAKIWDNHAAWMEEWKTQSTCKAPQLWAWFQWGHWENPPLARKPAGRESLADQAIQRWRDRIAAGEKPF